MANAWLSQNQPDRGALPLSNPAEAAIQCLVKDQTKGLKKPPIPAPEDRISHGASTVAGPGTART